MSLLRQQRERGLVSYAPLLTGVAPRQQPRPAPTKRTTPTSSAKGSPAALVDSYLASGRKPVALSQPKPQDSPPTGNWLGRGLGMVLNNPVVNTALRPLDVLDIPRRAVWSTVKEIKDQFVDGEGNEGGFSFQDLYDQINPLYAVTKKGDVTIGAGSVIPDTGNKWLDRGIGLAGDIIADPLTYVAGVGFIADAGTAAGRGGRALAAAKAADKAKVAGNFTDEVADALARVTREGYHVASPQQLSDMGVSGGIRFGIPFTGKQTRGVLPGVSKQTSRMRAGARKAADAVGFKPSERKLFDATSPKELEDAYSRLFRGEGPLSNRTAFDVVSTDAARRRGQGWLAGSYGKEVDGLKRQARRLSDDEKRAAIESIETGAPIDPDSFAGRVQDLFNRMWQSAVDAGVQLERRENYSPHILTRDAIQWLRGSGDEVDVKRLRGLVTEDLFAPSGVTMHRKFRPGETIELNGQLITLDGATIDELNQAFKAATGKTFNLYETDPVDILEKYVNMLSADVGTAVAAADRAAVPGSLITRNLLGPDGKPIVGTRETEEGVEAVSNLDPTRIRNTGADYTPGANAGRVVNPLPEGVQGPVIGGRADIDIIGDQLGQELDPNIYRATLDTEATEGLNTDITGGLMRERDRIQASNDQALGEIANTIDTLPAEPMARVSKWGDIRKKLTNAKKRLISERDRMVRQDGGWVLERDLPEIGLQKERAQRLGTLERQAERAAELDQQVRNIEAGVELYNKTIDDIVRDIEVMDVAADRAAQQTLRNHVKGLQQERDDLQRELDRIAQRQAAIPRPWQDDPGLAARQQAVTGDVAMERQNVQRLEQMVEDDPAVVIQREEVERLRAARASQTAPTDQVKQSREFLASTPDIDKYDNAVDVVERAARTANIEAPSPQRVSAARRFLNSEKGEAVRKHRETPKAWPTRPPDADVRRYDDALKLIENRDLARTAPTAAEVKAANKFLRSKRGRDIKAAREIVDSPATTNQATRTIDGRIRAAEERLAAARARAARELDNDEPLRLARERLAEAERRAKGPSVEGRAQAVDRTMNPAAANTPNLIPGAYGVTPTVRGVPVTELGDISSPAAKQALDIGRGQEALTPGSAKSKEVAEATRRHLENVTDPGEAERVRTSLTRGREDAKAVIRQDAARSAELMDEINTVNEALVTLIKDQDTRDNLRELWRQSFMANQQGPAREAANNAFDNLLSDYMTRQAGAEAQAEIARLRERAAKLRQDVSTVAETVPPAVGSQEALLARQAEQAGDQTRAVLNLPGQSRGANPMRGERTLAEIDADIFAARQATMDATNVYGQRQGQLEEGIERASDQLDDAQAMARSAHEAQRKAQEVVEQITDPNVKTEAGIYSDQLSDIANEAATASDVATANLLENAVEAARRLEEGDLNLNKVNQMITDGKNGKLARVVNIELADQWSIMERQTLGDAYLIHDDLRRAFQNVREAQYDKNFWPVVDGFTNFFKTYATLTPGFHVRNGMSAVFTNTAGGVPVSDQAEGMNLMRGFLRASKNGTQADWMAQNGSRVLNESTQLTVKDAFEAAFGSGIGGRFRERGFADRASVRGAVTEWMFNNRAVDLSKRAGGVVEGGVRLPVALDTLKKGGSMTDATQRINYLHFDYSQVSRFDEKARKLIPFWTFMSRNLPLQITQMWQRPRVYAWYNSFVRNFSGEAEPGTPEYFDKIGAFRFGDTMLGGLPMYLQPDLAHTRIEEDLERYTSALEGNPGQLLSDFNPFFTAPVEWATGNNLYTGARYDERDLRKTGGLETPIGAIARLLGQGEMTPGGDFATQERFISALRSVIPVYDRSLRLAPGITSGGYADDASARQIESILRFLGGPVRQLSPEQQQSTLRSQQFDERDRRAMERALAALDQ